MSFCRNLICLLFCSLGFAELSLALPQYAVRYNVINCTACHISPVGGGPRNINGKLFGAHGYEMNPQLAQKHFAADFRAMYYQPEKSTESKGGAGIMSGSLSLNVALDKAEKVQLVMEHNIAGFAAAGFRDTYALFKFADEEGKASAVDSLLVGRFRLPFGIITDEHRTYTRVQTATEWFSYETGLLLSGTPTDKVHYDIAMVNGDKSPGAALGSGQATRFGGGFNLRYMPGPVLLGLSTSFYEPAAPAKTRRASSFYGMLSVARWTDERVPVDIRVEHTLAEGWSDHLAQGFVSDPSYLAALATSDSEAWLVGLDYALNPHWTLIYKYDLLTPDKSFRADVYERHGVGFRWALASNTLLQFRTEIARATHPSEQSRASSAAQNATYGILQLAF